MSWRKSRYWGAVLLLVLGLAALSWLQFPAEAQVVEILLNAELTDQLLDPTINRWPVYETVAGMVRNDLCARCGSTRCPPLDTVIGMVQQLVEQPNLNYPAGNPYHVPLQDFSPEPDHITVPIEPNGEMYFDLYNASDVLTDHIFEQDVWDGECSVATVTPRPTFTPIPTTPPPPDDLCAPGDEEWANFCDLNGAGGDYGFCVHVCRGEYPNLGSLDNVASYLDATRLPLDTEVCLYDGMNFAGDEYCLQGNFPYGDLAPLGWDNRTSSIIIRYAPPPPLVPIEIYPSYHHFGVVPVGFQSTQLGLTVENTSDNSVLISDVRVTGAGAGNFTLSIGSGNVARSLQRPNLQTLCSVGMELSAGSACVFYGTYTVRSVGYESAQVIIETTDTVQRASVAGEVQAQVAVLGVDPQQEGSFVRVSGDGFVHDGVAFRFVGVNLHGITHLDKIWEGTAYPEKGIDGEWEEQLTAARDMGVKVIRIFAPHRDKNAAQAQADLVAFMDKADAVFGQDRVKFIVNLTNFYNDPQHLTTELDNAYDGDGRLYPEWFNSEDPDLNGSPNAFVNYEDRYKPFVRDFVGGLQGDTRIMAWQLGNEIQAGRADNNAGVRERMLAFSYTMGRYIKEELGAQQMVVPGFIGVNHAIAGEHLAGDINLTLCFVYQRWEPGATICDPSDGRKNSPFDFVYLHGYNTEWAPPPDAARKFPYQWQNYDYEWANAHGLPYVVGEFGFNGSYKDATRCKDGVYPGGYWEEALPSATESRIEADGGVGVLPRVMDRFFDQLSADGMLQWGFMANLPEYSGKTWSDNRLGDQCSGMDPEYYKDWDKMRDYYRSRADRLLPAQGTMVEAFRHDGYLMELSTNYVLVDGHAMIDLPSALIVRSVAASTQASATLMSSNLLAYRQGVERIEDFWYTFSDLPLSGTARLQVSRDSVTWYDIAGVLGNTTVLTATGNQTLDLAALNWYGPQFYYSMTLVSEDGVANLRLDTLGVTYAYWYASSRVYLPLVIRN